METGTTYKTIAGILLFLLIISYSINHSLKKRNNILMLQIDAYKSALSYANENIEEANSIIEDAQSYAWESYQDMGHALESLYTVDTASSPD